MDLLLILGVASGLLAAVLVNIAIWAPRRLWIKLAALATAACFLPIAYIGLAELLGRPKPAELDWAHGADDEATVLAARLREGQAIYLWLGFAAQDEPRSFVLPWSEAMARQLYGAQGEAQENGGEVRVRLPMNADLEREEPVFYAAPQPPPPAKAQPADTPLWFQRPSGATEG
jgi:hypothetical protein